MGVVRAWPRIRPRAASISARVGAVFVANVEDLLKDLTHSRERVESPFLHLVEQPLQLLVSLYRLLDVTPSAGGRDLEDLPRKIAATALLELALRLEPLVMLGDLLPECVEPFTPHRLRQHDRRLPAV